MVRGERDEEEQDEAPREEELRAHRTSERASERENHEVAAARARMLKVRAREASSTGAGDELAHTATKAKVGAMSSTSGRWWKSVRHGKARSTTASEPRKAVK